MFARRLILMLLFLGWSTGVLAGTIDEARSRWFSVAGKVLAAELAAWEAKASAGEIEALGVLYQVWWNGRIGYDTDETGRKLASWMLKVVSSTTGMLHWEYGWISMNIEKDPLRGAKWFASAANAGDARAMGDLGAAHEHGIGFPKSDIEAARWYKLGAEKGGAGAMTGYGVFLQTGRGGLGKDEKAAASWFRASAALGDPYGMYAFGFANETGLGELTKDERAAFEWYLKAAKAGNPVAMFRLGKLYTQGQVVAKDEIEAFKWYLGGANSGNPQAMREVAWASLAGLGTKRDSVEAARWYRRLANRGDGHAMAQLSKLYMTGNGVEQSDALAFEWASKGVEAGNSDAMNTLGLLFFRGLGVPRDESRANALWRQSADAGSAAGQWNLAHVYRDGLGGVAADKAKAMYWFQKSADQGHVPAYTTLGLLYIDGSGAQESAREGMKWVLKGAASEDPLGLAVYGYYQSYGWGVVKDGNAAALSLVKALEVTLQGDSLPVSRVLMLSRLEEMVARGDVQDHSVVNRIRALSKPAPSLEWTSAPAVSAQDMVSFEVQLADQGGGLGDVVVKANGTVVGTATGGRNAGTLAPAAGKARRTFTIRLPRGEHVLEVLAYSSENVGNFSRLTVKLDNTAAPVRRPKVYALVVGINEFENTQLRLNFAKDDARAVADLLLKESSKSKLYSGGEVVLLNEKKNTGKASILAALSSFQARMQYDDVFVFYVASHGLNAEGQYYLLTSDVLQTRQERLLEASISGSELTQVLRGIPSGKKIVVLDTCDSGGALSATALRTSRGLEEQQILNNIYSRAGAVVLSASETKEQALEGYKGHGVFTYAVLAGLRGAADANGDKFVTSDELKIYLEDQVPLLTFEAFKAKQSPRASSDGQGIHMVSVD